MPNSQRRDAITNPAATISVPMYSGLRTYAYGPLSASVRFFSRCPAAQARRARPNTETGSPAASEVHLGAASHRNAATIRKPPGTRSLATASAYGFGKLKGTMPRLLRLGLRRACYRRRPRGVCNWSLRWRFARRAAFRHRDHGTQDLWVRRSRPRAYRAPLPN